MLLSLNNHALLAMQGVMDMCGTQELLFAVSAAGCAQQCKVAPE